MRSNPYGADVVANPDQIRLAMAGTDPRQRGLFAAAWAIGAVAATEQHGISSIALAAMVGPLGIIYRRATWPQPMYDDRPSSAVYPLFHVIRAISEIAGAPRLSIVGASRSWSASPARPVWAAGFFLPISPTRRVLSPFRRTQLCGASTKIRSTLRLKIPTGCSTAIPNTKQISPSTLCSCLRRASDTLRLTGHRRKDDSPRGLSPKS